MESNETNRGEDRDYHEVGTKRLKPLVQHIDDAMVEAIAVVCHEANRAYCFVAMNDNSQVGWFEAPTWQRESARSGVRGILEGRITEPHESHVSWLNEKVADGWTWGAVKNPMLKQHPCIVPYEDLPPEQRRKDALFLAIVRGLAS